MFCCVYTCKIVSLSEWGGGILGAAYYNRLVMHVLRREMVYSDRLNPFDRYDDWD